MAASMYGVWDAPLTILATVAIAWKYATENQRFNRLSAFQVPESGPRCVCRARLGAKAAATAGLA